MSIVSFLAVPIIIIAAAVIVVSLFLHFVPIGLWISAMAAGVSVGIVNLIGMRLRRVIPSKIILPLVKANKAGLDVNVNQLEAHYLAGGDVDRVVDALIAAHRATMSLTFERACAIDLAGRDVLEAVQMSVNPKVIETPFISAVAQNGIELKVRARVTVRANIDRLVGGAGEATVIARVGESGKAYLREHKAELTAERRKSAEQRAKRRAQQAEPQAADKHLLEVHIPKEREIRGERKALARKKRGQAKRKQRNEHEKHDKQHTGQHQRRRNPTIFSIHRRFHPFRRHNVR